LKVKLAKTFPMPAAAEEAWALLQDIEGVAACMPGARITERLDERHYKGTVSVRFGPASMAFRGELEVLSLEAATRTLRLLGKGTDSTGGSGASMALSARIDAVSASACNLVGESEVSMSGKAAAFGSRAAEAVAAQALKQFAANFAAALQARATAGGPSAAAHPAAPAASAGRAGQLSGFALLGGVLLSWLRALFGARDA
jgi:carbon monoxide dehydrogenase subunit G